LFIFDQRGPTTFNLRAILHKHDNLQATSKKMYKTTDSQHLELKVKISVSFKLLHNSK